MIYASILSVVDWRDSGECQRAVETIDKQSSGFVFALERVLWNAPTLRVICSGKYVVQHVSMHVGQAEITATMPVGQFLVIDS